MSRDLASCAIPCTPSRWGVRETDRVAEIQNTLRAATEVPLLETEAEVIGDEIA